MLLRFKVVFTLFGSRGGDGGGGAGVGVGDASDKTGLEITGVEVLGAAAAGDSTVSAGADSSSLFFLMPPRQR